MNVKPGDLAIVVRARLTPELNGRVVRVVRPAVGGELFETCHGRWVEFNGKGFAWVIECDRPMPWRLSWNGVLAGLAMMVSRRAIMDGALMRIGGVPVHDEQPEEAKEPA